jgi:hypothetical protein
MMGTLAERFEHNTMPEPNSGCLLWLGAARGRPGNSYGVIRDEGKQTTATHVAFKLAGKEVPAGKFALHRCDNPYCVNVGHLFVGTKKENTADAIAKGRHKAWGQIRYSKAGEKNGRALLTEANVAEIRKIYFANMGKKYVKRGTREALSIRFGVSTNVITKVISGRTWGHEAAFMAAIDEVPLFLRAE